MHPNDDFGRGYPSNGALKRHYADASADGFPRSISRQRALRLFGGVFLAGVLAPVAGGCSSTPDARYTAALPRVTADNILTTIDIIKGVWELREPITKAAEYIIGLFDTDSDEGKQISDLTYSPNHTNGPAIRQASQPDPGNVWPFASNSAKWANLSDVDPTPEQVARKYAQPGDEEELAYEMLTANTPRTVPVDTWFTARIKLVDLYGRSDAYDRAMLEAFYVTQWALARAWYRDWKAWENYRYQKDTYINFFTWYGGQAQRVNPVPQQLSYSSLQERADGVYEILNQYWSLQQISPREARGLAFAWALTSPEQQL